VAQRIEVSIDTYWADRRARARPNPFKPRPKGRVKSDGAHVTGVMPPLRVELHTMGPKELMKINDELGSESMFF
jgi:hypothetical protein